MRIHTNQARKKKTESRVCKNLFDCISRLPLCVVSRVCLLRVYRRVSCMYLYVYKILL